MKQVFLREIMVQELSEAKATRFSYAVNCRNVVMFGRQGGYTIDEMFARRGLVQKLKEASAGVEEEALGPARELLLEEEEYELLVKELRAYHWPAYSDAALEMYEEIRTAPAVEVEVKKGAASD